MKRHLFNVLAAVSLVLCVAAATSWAVGVTKPVRKGWHGGGIVLNSSITLWADSPYAGQNPTWKQADDGSWDRRIGYKRLRFWGFDFSWHNSLKHSDNTGLHVLYIRDAVTVPLWMAVVATAVLPIAWWFWRKARKRSQVGFAIEPAKKLAETSN